MFDFLSSASSDQAVGGVYYAMRLMKHRDSLGNAKNGRRFKALLNDSSPDERELALKVIDEIERAEKMPLTSLNKSKAAKYVKRLSDIVLHQVRKELNDDDTKRGQKLLKQLRQSDPSTLRYSRKTSLRRSR